MEMLKIVDSDGDVYYYQATLVERIFVLLSGETDGKISVEIRFVDEGKLPEYIHVTKEEAQRLNSELTNAEPCANFESLEVSFGGGNVHP